MLWETRIKLDGQEFTVEWESYEDELIPDRKRIFQGTIHNCPEWALKKYGEGIIIFICRKEEEDLQKEREIERRLDATD